MQRGKSASTRQPSQLCKLLSIFEEMFQLAGLGHGLGTVVESCFRYGVALRNLADTTMCMTRQSLPEALAMLLAPLFGGVILGRTSFWLW